MTYKKSFYLFLLIISVLSLFLSINILIKANEVSSLNLTSETIEISNANLIDDNKSSTDDSDKTSILNQSSPVSPDRNYSGNYLEREAGGSSSPIDSSFNKITEVRSGNSGSANSSDTALISNQSKLETESQIGDDPNSLNVTPLAFDVVYFVEAYYTDDGVNYYQGSSGGTINIAATSYEGDLSSYKFFGSWYSNVTLDCSNVPGVDSMRLKFCAKNNDGYHYRGMADRLVLGKPDNPTGTGKEYVDGVYCYVSRQRSINYNDHGSETFYAVFEKATTPDPIDDGSARFEISWDSSCMEYVSIQSVGGYQSYYYSSPFVGYFNEGQRVIVHPRPKADEGYSYKGFNYGGWISWPAHSWTWDDGPTIVFTIEGPEAEIQFYGGYIIRHKPTSYNSITDTINKDYAGGRAKITSVGTIDLDNDWDFTWWSWSLSNYEQVRLYTKPEPNYTFMGWYKATNEFTLAYSWRTVDDPNVTVATNSAGDTIYHTITDEVGPNFHYYAVFLKEEDRYSLTIEADPGINVAGGTGTFSYIAGQSLNLIINGSVSSISIFNVTMSGGYGFDGWEIIVGPRPIGFTGFNYLSINQSSNLVMPSYDVHLKAKSNSHKYGVKVVAASSTDAGIFVYNGITSPGGLVGFSLSSGLTSLSPSSVHYVNVGNYINIAVGNINNNYKFIGWYKTVNATEYDDNYRGPYTSTPSEIITEAMVEGKVGGDIVLTYYAVFCKYYALTNNAEADIETGKIIATTQSKQYYFTEQIRLFADVSENYNWDGWTLVSGTLPKRIDGTDMDLYSLNQIIIMPASGLTISAKTSIKIYAIEIIACYQDNTGNIYQATIGGKVSLGGEFSATRMGVVEHGSLITLGVQLNDNVGTDMLYALKGWYLDINGTQPFFSYNAPQTKETYIYEQFEITESMVLYAIITTCYKCIIEKDEGIASTTKSGSAYYFSNDELQVTATVKDKHIFDGWYKKETGGTESLHTSNPTFSYQVKQNIIFTAKTTKEFNLNVIEMTQNSMGGYNQFPIGGTVQDGLIFAGTILVDLVEVNNGFQFDGFFYNSYLTNPYNGTTMENNDMTLYAKFIRKSYPISLITKYTNSSDNNTLITGFGGGTCVGPYSDISSGKYGYTYPLETSANAGFEFYGIYTSNVSRISGNAPYMLANGSCNFSTPSIPIGGITICVVFSRAFYNVTLDVGKETNLTVNGLNNGKAYYGQSLSYTVTAKNGYANPSIEVFKTATGVSVLYNSSNFTMPETAITVRSSATAISYDLTYNPNGGAFSTETYPNSILNGNILGEIAYETKNYKYLIGSQTVPGVPLPGRAGYKIIGWNTESNGSGEYYVSYNDENVTYKEWDRLSDLTLYAVWEAVKPLLSLTQYINEFTYDGKYHEVLNVIVQNYVAGKTYLYEWINSGSGEIIFSEQGTYGNHTLQLRTPNESGIFSIYCRVTIVGEGLSERTVGEKTVRINKKELTVILGNREMVGDYSFWLTETDLIGLADGHRLQSGSLSFASSADEITYSETSNKNAIDRTITLSTIDSSQGHLPVTQQDGKDLIDNYIIKYSGEVKIKNPTDYIQLIVGGYERTVNPTTFSDVYKTTTLVGLDFEIEYESLESDLIRNEDGTQSVYIDWATVPRNLIFKFSAVPAGYKIYRISGGNIFLDSSDFTVTESGVIEIEFNLKSGMISTDENLIDIKIYFTNQAVVTYNYEFLGDELFGGYASYDGVNKRILTNGIIYPISANAAQPTRKGFNFDGWFYDEEKILYPVGTTWLKTGIITIYAKWTLRNITAADITITAKDNGIEMEKPFTRTYNTNTIALDYILNPEIKNPVISYEDMWYKWTGTGSSYYRIYNISLKNVADSGRYGVFIKPTYNGLTAVYTFNLDNKNEQVTITPQEITLALQISKTYDATTALGAYNIDGVGGERLRLLGSYSTANADVAVPITDLGLQGYSGSNAANYTLKNTQYNGIINPCNYEINITDEKDYDGNYYTSVFNRDITLIGETQTLTFTLITNGANCGLYKPTTPERLLSVQDNFTVINALGQAVSKGNYHLTVKNTSTIHILKVNLSGIYFDNKTVYYNGLEQFISITDSTGNSYSSANLPIGATKIDYYNNTGALISGGFTNAGIYNVRVFITADSNHNNWESTSAKQLTIKKATLSFNFLYNGETLAPYYTYTGENFYNGLSINATNQSGTGVVPTINKIIRKDVAIVTEVIDPGTYELEAMFESQNYEPVVQNGHKKTFDITMREYIVGQDIIFNPVISIYAGKNLVNNEFIDGNLILPTGIQRTTYRIYNNEQMLVPEAKNVGTYTIQIFLNSSNESKWKLDQNYIDGTLNIIKFIINDSNTETFKAEKVYDGTDMLPAGAYLSITLASQIIEHIGINGNYLSINASVNEISLKDISLKNYSSFLASNYEIADLNEFNPLGRITPKDMAIELYKEYLSPTYNTYLQSQFNGQIAVFDINKTENENYVKGTVAGEYIEMSFRTQGSEKGKYPFGAGSEGFTIYGSAVRVYTATGGLINDGINNYNLTVSGGIEIVEILTEVEFLGLSEQKYIGSAINFSIILTTTDTINDVIIVNEFDYIYDSGTAGYFKNNSGGQVDALELSLTIKYGVANDEVFNILNAGLYTLTLRSENYSYIFAETSERNLTEQIEVLKAETTFDLGIIEVTYSNPLSHTPKDIFLGVADEIFYIRINYDTTRFDVNEYDLSNLITLDNITLLSSSTAEIKNYEITIIGTLQIAPKEITAENVYSGLNLVYSGENYYEHANFTANIFRDNENNPIELTKGIDFWLKFLFNNNETEELINAGTYTAILSSKNYVLLGETPAELGEYNFVELEFEIAKKDAIISLYKDETAGEFIKLKFSNQILIFAITETNQNFVKGTAFGEYITATFVTSDSTKGSYPYSDDVSEDACTRKFDDFAVFNAEGEVRNGVNNYNITIIGGIDIIYILTEVEFIYVQSPEYISILNPIYNAEIYIIKVVLVTDYTPLNDGRGEDREEFEYIYKPNNYFNKGIYEEIPTERLDLDIKFSGANVDWIKDAGEYNLTLISENYYYTFVIGLEAPSITYETTATVAKASVNFNFGENQIAYGKNWNVEREFDGVGEGEFFEKFFIEANCDTESFDVGEYNLSDIITSKDYQPITPPAGWEKVAEFKNYNVTISGTLTIVPRSVTASIDFVSLNLIYNSQNQISKVRNAQINFQDAESNPEGSLALEVNWDYGLTFLKDSTITDVIKNAGEYTARLSSTNYRFMGGNNSEILGGENYIDIIFSMGQAALKIRLFDTYSQNPDEQVLIQRYYTGSPIIVQLDNTNVKLTSGAAGNEYVVVSYITFAESVGKYFYDAGGVNQLGDLSIYDKNGEIVGGMANYIISVEGGIEIILQSTLVEFTNLDSLVYNGERFEISMKLTRFESGIFVDETEFEYDYDNEQFKYKSTGVSISTDILKLNINSVSASATNVLKNVGNYVLELINENVSYMFSSSGGQQHIENIIIKAVPVTFDLGIRYTDYSEDFDKEISFDGVGGEIFNIAFNCATNLFNVGHYDFVTLLTSQNYNYATSPASTAVFENYIITISGVLQVNPKEIEVIGNAYAALGLVYSGINRITEAGSAVNTFSGNNRVLKKDTDFSVNFKQNSIEVKEIINAGTYTAILSSTNYKFIGGTDSGILGGKNYFDMDFSVEQAALKIRLFDTYSIIPSEQVLIQKYYTGSPIIVQLDNTNAVKFTNGAMGTEYVVVSYRTSAKNAGEYFYGTGVSQFGTLFIYDKGDEIVGGAANYNISVEGGIEIIMQSTLVEFTNLSSLVYKNENFEILMQLTRLEGKVIVDETEFEYDYINEQFKNKETGTSISTDILKLNINGESASSTNVLKNAGNYTLDLINTDGSYMFSSSGGQEHTKNVIIDAVSIIFDLGMRYIDYSEDFDEEISFDGVGGEIFNIAFNCGTNLFNVGHYDFETFVTSDNYDYATSPASTAIFENYIITISGVLQINPKEIGIVGNAYAALNLIYSGVNRINEVDSAVNTFSGNIHPLVKDTDFWVKFTQNSIEVKEIINVGTYTAVLSSKNYVFAGKTPAELGGLNFVELNFNISKKDLTVALFSKDNATEFIKLKYRNQILTFNITQDNFQDYITGTVNGEKITTAFATNSGLEGLYPYSESNPDKFTKQSVGFVIYSAGGTVMPDGLNNYNVLPISGGIDIVYIFTTVEFVDLQGLTYNGSNREFSINLITDLTPLGSDFEIVEESLTIVYGASGNFFKQDDVEISTNKLNVSIERDTAAVGTIKRVGQYKITIKSLNSDYVFEGAVVGTPSDSYSYNTQITKANIDFSLDTITIQYGNILTETKTFNGVGNEVFVLKLLNSNVAVMWVKSYNIADYVTLANFTYIDGNTADFENYNITITGILDIIARKIVATADFGELIYNGKTYYSTIKNTTITFKDAETPYQERELRIGKDYIQKFFNSKGQETTDFIQAGLYNVQLSSTNHEFIGNSATKNGDYNLFELEVEIQKAPMQINLFNTYDAENPENNQLICALYNDKFAEFELTNSNNAKYISGAVNGEHVLGTFRTNGVVVGEYLYSDTELSTDLMVIKSNGSAIINGLDNYDISISGGIEIILNLTQAEFIGLENLVYSGTNIPINVILSLYDITGAEVSKHFVYDYENSQFISGGVVVPTSELSLEINDIAVSDTKNAGTYDLTLISEDFTYVFSDESNKSVKVINIIPAEIILDLGYKEIFYGENFNYSADNPFDGVGDEQFYLSFTHDTSNFGVENSPYPFGFLNADSVSYIEGKSNPLNFKDNYNITFAGELIIKAQEITVEEKFSSFSSEYNGTDKITEIYAVDNIFRNKSGDLINLELGIDYSLTIYNSGTQVNQIINAGTYQATLSSTNYNFEGAILIGGIYNISFEFNIASRNIAVDFVIEPNLVYNGTNQNPVSWSWLYAGSSDETDAIINSDNLGETLLYSNGFDYVRNAGGYTVTLSIMNSNYLIVGGAQSVPFIISPFVIFPAEPSAIYFEKFFNAFEPELIFDHYQELNESGEIVKIKFEREAGETVGQYALTSPTLDTAKNSALIQNNFTVDASEFIDNFKAFLIKPLEGEEGNLTIIQKQNIEIIYNAQTHTSISYEDYSDCFIILNYMGDELEVGEFDLTADFTFGTGIVVRNAGEYNLILGSANSLTHQGEQLNFDNNGFSFVILKREIDVENSSGDKINKQYDKTSEATVDSILNLSNVCVEDIDAVTLTAIYVDADLQEIINVGNDYFLLLKLTGSEAENYYIIYEKIFHFTGDITPRKLTVTGNSNAFDKEYDKTSNVNTAFLTLENTIAGDEVEYNGKYISGAVEVNTVGTYEITFTTTNSNYVIILIGGQVYTGEITQRILTVSDTSTLFKSYDETPELDVSKIDITARIIDGDIVNLNSAVLADSIEGVHDITFTLDGADSANYTVESRLGEIVPMVVEIRFHYGDESGVYELPFANDGEKIIKTIINLDVIYGTRMNDVRNGIASLPLTERKGYEFSGWFTSMDTTPDSAFYISTIIDEPNFILDDIILNGGFIDVYAKWNIKQFVLQIELHTERADNSGYYIQSNEGGSYSINGKTYNNTFETIIFDYYTLIDFDFSPKTNFNFDGLYQIMDKLTEEMNYSYTVKTDNEILIIKFERKVYRVFITTDTPAGKLSGFTNGWNYDENFGIAVRFVKSGEIISLPQLNRIGYNLVGFAENESGVPTYNAGDTFNIIDTDLEFFAKWQAKEYNVYLDYAGGTLAQSYSRAIFDDVLGGYYITITFDSIFGELPLLEKPGFLQKLWMLEKGETILSVDNSKNTLWVFALDSDEPYILVATWETDENTIELTSDLNSELYTEKGISIYNSYDNVLSVLCFLNGQSVGEYSSALTATTGSKVQLSAINNSEYYVFDGWYIVEGGIETQIIDTMIINGATFEAIDENLIIFDFTWGVNCPEIIAKYKPFAVEVVLGDYAETYANIDFASGIYEENEKSWTLTGAVVSVEYTVSPGYELIGIEIINASYEQFGGETGSGSINIYDFNKRVEINFKFDRQAYELTINTTGEINGIGSLKYLVIESDESGSTNEFMLYSIPILIKTDQFVIIQLGIKYGYENLVDWTWTGGGDNVEISKTNEFYESNLLIVEKEIFGFISELTLSIELQKQVFEVNATCEIYTDDGYIIDTTENQYKITDSNGTDINSAEYLDEVTFSAMCFIANFNHNDTQLEIQKYEFIGWFVKINDMYINKSDALNYTIELEADTALIARFKLKNYNINLEVKNNEGGYLITETGQTHQTLLIVEFGKSLTNSVHINRNGGYVFVRWEVTYSYMAFDNGLETTVDFTEYLTTETIEPNDIGIICGNILISAEFDTKEITVEAQALFIDETTDVDTKISLSYLGETGIYLIFESRTHEEIIITAHTLLEGYAFLYWDIPGTYDILSESISELCEGGYYLISSTIKIKYTDDSDNQTITAYFERFEHQVITTLKLDNGQTLGGGFVSDSDDHGAEPVLTSFVKTEEFFEIYVTLYDGYFIDLDSPLENWCYVSGLSKENISIVLEEITSMNFKLTISGVLYRTDIIIHVERNKTEFRFFDKGENDWIFSGNTAIVEYGTNKILIVGDDSFLIPTQTTHDFLGWSRDKIILNIIITADGNLNFDKWFENDASIDLYARWDFRKIKLDVTVDPISATFTQDYYPELFRNLGSSQPIQIDNNFYFYVGATFGISLPNVKTQYGFIEYSVLKPNGNGGFVWHSIEYKPGLTELSKSLFSIESYSDYIYSTSNGSGFDVSNLTDGTIYIKLIYGINVTLKNMNYYDSNTISYQEIGDSNSRINTNLTFGTFRIGTEIQLSAFTGIGYEFKYWLINEVAYAEKQQTVTVCEDMNVVKAFFVGKRVKLNVMETPEGQGGPISGGNIEEIDGIIYYHVGDVLLLNAMPSIGYKFENKWIHKTAGEFQSTYYAINERDGVAELLELTPMFAQKDLDVRFQIEGSRGNVELESEKDVRFKVTIVESKAIFSYTTNYFSEISVQINANDKFKYVSILMYINGTSTDVSHLVDASGLFTISQTVGFNNTDEVLFVLNYKKIYWYEYIVEEERLHIDGEEHEILYDLVGKGEAGDPYKISTIEDYALWAYIINHNLVQTNSNKTPYNTPFTYYEIDSQVFFNARYWTPIGTSQNPFNGSVHILYGARRIGIDVDVEDEKYPVELFDAEVLQQWGGLFGYLSDTAEIIEVEPNFAIILLIGGGIALVIAIVIIATSSITNRRQRLFSSLNKPRLLK